MRSSLGMLIFACSLSSILSAEPSKPTPVPTLQEMQRWVRELGDESFQIREAATEKLRKAGRHAEPLLLETLAKKDLDREVQRRCTEIIEPYKWGLYPDTPKVLVDLISQYQSEPTESRSRFIGDFYEQGPAGCRVVQRICQAETDLEQCKILKDAARHSLSRAMPALLQEKKLEELEPLLWFLLEDFKLYEDEVRNVGLCHFLAYAHFTGKGESFVKQVQEKAKKEDQAHWRTEILPRLLRMLGRHEEAVKIAEKADDRELLAQLLFDRRDWAALAEKKLGAVSAHGGGASEDQGFLAAYCRLSGNQLEEQAQLNLLKEACKVKNEEQASEDYKHWIAVKALLLNHAFDDAFSLMQGEKASPVHYQLLLAQHKFKEAETKFAAKIAEQNLMPHRIHRARTMYELGEKEKGLNLLQEMLLNLETENMSQWREELLSAFLRLGRKDLALQCCAQELTDPTRTPSQSRMSTTLFDRVYYKRGMYTLWLTRLSLQREPKKPLPVLLTWVAKGMDGKLSPDTLQDSINFVQALGDDVSASRKAEYWLGLAEAATAGQHHRLAQTCLEHATGLESGISHKLSIREMNALNFNQLCALRLGDCFYEQKKWEQANVWYGRAWRKAPQNPLPVYLQSLALQQLKRETESNDLRVLATWLALGTEKTRYDYANELYERNHRAEARLQREHLVKIHGLHSTLTSDVPRFQAIEASGKKEYAAAASGWAMVEMRALRAYFYFYDPAAYMRVPSYVRRYQAAAYIQQGKIEAGLREAKIALQINPGDGETTALIYDELVKKGRQKEADEMYQSTVQTQEALLKEYPRYAQAHNSLAWLRARTRRDLPKALVHAEKAVAEAPELVGFVDTLAEVHFQLGNKEKALEAIKQCVDREPKRVFYKKQKARIEAGDPKAPLPDENND